MKVHAKAFGDFLDDLAARGFAQYAAYRPDQVYLLPESNIKLRPILDAQLKKGTRIVAHDFEIGGWTPVKTLAIADDGEGRSHMLYLYVR